VAMETPYGKAVVHLDGKGADVELPSGAAVPVGPVPARDLAAFTELPLSSIGVHRSWVFTARRHTVTVFALRPIPSRAWGMKLSGGFVGLSWKCSPRFGGENIGTDNAGLSVLIGFSVATPARLYRSSKRTCTVAPDGN